MFTELALCMATIGGLLLFPREAAAYLDAASGTAILQGLIAALGAVLVALRLFWRRILAWLGLRAPTSQDEK